VLRQFCCRRNHAQLTSEPGPYWTSERRPLLQYVKLLVAAAERGDAAEVSWFLRKEPAALSDLQPEAFHCALFVAVISGHHSTAEALLQHQNPDKGALTLPVCRPGLKVWGVSEDFDAGMETSFLALSYGWDSSSGYVSEEDRELLRKRPDKLCGAQYLGLMQLLLEYGVAPASAVQGLLQKLTLTADMAAMTLLQAHNFNLGDCVLSEGQTMLHLLVSTQCHDQRFYRCSGNYPSDSDRRQMQLTFEQDMKEWQDQAMPLLQLLLSTEGATIKRDDNNKTAMDACLKEYTQFMSAMNNARLSAQPARRDNSEAAQAHCVICMDRQPSVVIIPCGHLCVCQSCSGRLQQLCPVCRGAATQMIQTFTP